MSDAADGLIEIPAGPFLLGADYEQIAPEIRASDQAKCLGLGAVLAATPPHWVDLPAFRIMPRLVTNGQYREFWTAPHPEDPSRLFIDDYELWSYVWELYRLTEVRVPASERGSALVEQYGGCHTAIDALVRSYAYEAQRLLLGHHMPPTEAGYDALSRALARCFALLRRGLARVIWSGPPRFDPGEREALDAIASPTQAVDEVRLVEDAVAERHGIASQGRPTPLQVVLLRLRRALEAGEEQFSPGVIFRPLLWPDDSDRPRRGGLFMQRVPWEDLPVTGISLYEAAAFAAWLRVRTGLSFVLPSEAEYEKAFGWVLEGEELTPARKHIYPWQGVNTLDFNQWFSRDGHSVRALESRAAAYRALLEDTARPIGAQKLYQGLGFGWQWTRERFSELERKYNRFSHAGCLRRRLGQLTVHTYQDCVDVHCRYFAVRGAPDQLGGPGTVTRRFALSPLRGYEECGFRCVVSAAGDG